MLLLLVSITTTSLPLLQNTIPPSQEIKYSTEENNSRVVTELLPRDKTCTCVCPRPPKIMTIKYLVNITKGNMEVMPLHKTLAPSPNAMSKLVDLREHYKSYKVIVTKLIENKQADEITLSITKFTAINMVTKDKYDAHVIVVINEKNKYGFILYRLSSEEAYIYMVIPGTIPIAHAFVVKASNNNMLDYFKELSKGLETISYLTNESKWSVMSIELESKQHTYSSRY